MKRILFFFAIIFMIVSGSIYAQHTRLGFGAGPSYLTQPDNYYLIDLDKGLNFGLQIKTPISNIPLTIDVQMNYTRYSGTILGPYPSWNGSEYGYEEHEVTSTIISVHPGFEYFIMQGQASPYISADFIASILSMYGWEDWGLGLGLGGGTEIGLSSKLAIDISVRYNFYNVFLREENPKVDAVNINAYLLFGSK